MKVDKINMKTLFKIIQSLKSRQPKFILEGNSDKGQPNPIDSMRNKIRSNEITKYVIEKGLLVKGQKFGELRFTHQNQVNALMRKLKVTINDYVTNTFTSEIQYIQVLKRQNYLTCEKYPQFFDFHSNENEKFATLKPYTSELHSQLTQLVIDQLIEQFTSILNKKVVKK